MHIRYCGLNNCYFCFISPVMYKNFPKLETCFFIRKLFSMEQSSIIKLFQHHKLTLNKAEQSHKIFPEKIPLSEDDSASLSNCKLCYTFKIKKSWTISIQIINIVHSQQSKIAVWINGSLKKGLGYLKDSSILMH